MKTKGSFLRCFNATSYAYIAVKTNQIQVPLACPVASGNSQYGPAQHPDNPLVARAASCAHIAAVYALFALIHIDEERVVGR